jgi:hypothetical protein
LSSGFCASQGVIEICASIRAFRTQQLLLAIRELHSRKAKLVPEMNDPQLRETDFPAGGLMTTAGDIAS